MKLKQLFNLIGSDMQAVDAVIRTRLHSEVVLVRQVAEYIIQSGGKRLRPALVLLSAGASWMALRISTPMEIGRPPPPYSSGMSAASRPR